MNQKALCKYKDLFDLGELLRISEGVQICDT